MHELLKHIEPIVIVKGMSIYELTYSGQTTYQIMAGKDTLQATGDHRDYIGGQDTLNNAIDMAIEYHVELTTRFCKNYHYDRTYPARS